VKLSLIPMSGQGGAPRYDKPVLRVELNEVRTAGIQALDLSTAKRPDGMPVKLEKGIPYRWAVVLELSKAEGGKNPTSQCALVRVDAKDALAAATSAGGWDAAVAYAQAGIWYDALAALHQAIEADRGDTSLRDARRQLLASQKLLEDETGSIVDVTQAK
jgi:hypothetical protein